MICENYIKLTFQLHKDLFEHSCAHSLTYGLWSLSSNNLSCIVATKTIESTEPKILTIYSSTERASQVVQW